MWQINFQHYYINGVLKLTSDKIKFSTSTSSPLSEKSACSSIASLQENCMLISSWDNITNYHDNGN